MIHRITTLHFDVGEIRIFDNFVLAVMNEGTTVMPEHNDELLTIARTYFKDRPFGYITYRKYSYAVDPLVYLKTSKIDNLVAFAVVANDGIKESNVEVEKLFLTKPFHHFKDLEKAKEWVDELVKKESNSSN